MSRPVAASWFISAYSPLLALLSVKEFALGEYVTTGVLVAIAVAGIFISRLALLDRFTPSSSLFRIEKIVPADPGIGTYMATFVLPFVTITGATATDILVIVCFLALLAYLLLHFHILLPNPTLALMRYQWCLVTLEGGAQWQVLVPPSYPLREHTRRTLPIGAGQLSNEQKLYMCKLTEGLWLAKEAPLTNGG